MSERNNEILRKAAGDGDNQFIEFLLRENKADINGKSKQGWTALHCAANEQKLSTISLLINSGANVNEQDNEGFTALMNAASIDDTETIKVLLDHGADLKIKNKKGKTSLSIAKKSKCPKAISILESYLENKKLMKNIDSDQPNNSITF